MGDMWSPNNNVLFASSASCIYWKHCTPNTFEELVGFNYRILKRFMQILASRIRFYLVYSLCNVRTHYSVFLVFTNHFTRTD